MNATAQKFFKMLSQVVEFRVSSLVLGVRLMHQSFESPSPIPGMAGIFTQCECESQWDTRAKIPSEVPAPQYSAVQTKVPCVESAVTAFLKSPHQTLKSISKIRKRERKLRK